MEQEHNKTQINVQRMVKAVAKRKKKKKSKQLLLKAHEVSEMAPIEAGVYGELNDESIQQTQRISPSYLSALPAVSSPTIYHPSISYPASSTVVSSQSISTQAAASVSGARPDSKQADDVAPVSQVTGLKELSAQLSPLALQKLDDPKLPLTLEQSIQCLIQYIDLGNEQARKARGKELVFFLGGTGAGKSTTINYLHGCTMEYFKDPEKKGTLGKSVRVSAASAVPQLMEIGHSKKSATFIPTIASDAQLTYCDCPGFFDTRGAEVSIANIANIKNVLQNAKSIKVVIIIDYPSLKAQRGQAIDNLMKMIAHLFKMPEGSLASSSLPAESAMLNSLLIGVTRIFEQDEVSLADIRDFIFEDSTNPFSMRLKENIFIFDPTERAKIEGLVSKSAIIDKIRQLPGLTDLTTLNLPLDGECQLKLREINEQLSKRIAGLLQAKKFLKSAWYLRRFKYLQVLNHELIDQLYAKNVEEIERFIRATKKSCEDSAASMQFERAKEIFVFMKNLCRAFFPELDLRSELFQTEQFLRREMARQRLERIKGALLACCQEMDTQIKWEINGKKVLLLLSSQQRDLLAGLSKVSGLTAIVEKLSGLLNEGAKIATFLQEPAAEQTCIDIYKQELGRLSKRLKKEEAQEILKDSGLKITEFFNVIEAKLVEPSINEEVLETIKKYLADPKQCLTHLRGIRAIAGYVRELDSFLFEKIPACCAVLEDAGRVKVYNDLCKGKLIALQEKLAREIAAALVARVGDHLQKREFEKTKEVLRSISRLDSKQQGGWITLKSHVDSLVALYRGHFDSGDYTSADTVMSSLKQLSHVLSDGTFKHELMKHGIMELKKLEEELLQRSQSSQVEAQKEILKALAKDTLKNIDEVSRTLLPHVTRYWRMMQGFKGLFASQNQSEIDQLKRTMLAHANEIYKQITTEEKSQDRALGSEVAMLFIQLYSIAAATQSPELVDFSNQIVREFLKDNQKTSYLCAHIGNILNHARGLENVGRYAAKIIEDHGQFKRLSVQIFNAKATKTADQFLKELKISDDTPLSHAYQTYDRIYSGILGRIVEESRSSSGNLSVIKAEAVKEAKKGALELADKFPRMVSYPEPLGYLIANIFGAWSCLDAEDTSRGVFNFDRSTLQQPHPMQIFSILLLLGMKDMAGLQDQMIQVKTGEGKSLIAAGVAIVLALLGLETDIGCYSEYLSTRDEEQFRKLFILFEVSTAIEYGLFGRFMDSCVSTHIGDPRKLTEELLENKLVGGTLKKSSKKRVLFFDEVDVFFSKTFLGRTYNPLVSIRHDSFYSLLKEIWEKREEYLKDLPRSRQLIARHTEMKAFLERYPKVAHFLTPTVENILSDLGSVADGRHQYILTESKQDRGTTSASGVQGIGYLDQGTGNVEYDTFRGYRTAFAYLKHSKSLSEDVVKRNVFFRLVVGQLSYAELPRYYSYRLGLTGTLESLSDPEKMIVQKYSKLYHCMPSCFEKKPLQGSRSVEVYDGAIDTDDAKGYFSNIRKELISVVKNDRAVLVVFQNMQRLEEFKSYITKHPFGLPYVKCDYLTERTAPQKMSIIISQAASRGQITLITKIFGRGSDFVCRDSALRKKGGLHVIQTFFSQHEAEEVQIKGRTCRQDDPGSYKMILFLDDLKKFGIEKQSDVDTFFTENTALAPEDVDSRWYVFLQAKRQEHLAKKIKILTGKIEQVKKPHEDTVRYISLLEGSGNSLFHRVVDGATQLITGTSQQKKRQEEALEILMNKLQFK